MSDTGTALGAALRIAEPFESSLSALNSVVDQHRSP